MWITPRMAPTHDRQHDAGDHDDARPSALRPRAGSACDTPGREAGAAEVVARERELHQADAACRAPTQQKPTRQPYSCGDQRHERRAEERAEVDAHVEDREAGITTRAAFRIELRDDGADVRLQQPDAEHDHARGRRRTAACVPDGEQRVADHDEDAAPPHRALRADQPVRDPAAEQRQQVRAGDVETVDGVAGLVVDAEPALLDRRRPGTAPGSRACRSR